MDCAEIIRVELSGLLESRGHAQPEISANDALTGTVGLSSGDILALVPRLNSMLGVDPFAGTLAITDLRTVGDLVRAYQNARSTAANAATGSDALRAAAKRAELRRRRTG